MLLAEDLLLLVTDDASGRLSAPAEQVDAGLGGANLVELTLRDKVNLAGDQDPGKPGAPSSVTGLRPVMRSWTRRWRSSSRARARSHLR